VRIDRPSESWTSGRKSSVCCREFSPRQNMLVSGATPSTAIAWRGKSAART
jgi:hypothetical protein